MGCDGGTIPRRDELVKTKKKPEAKDKDSERLYRWKHCAVSQSKLLYPVVACELGRMYNKEEVISRLLAKSNDPAISHIRGLKDLKELRLTPNPSYREDLPRGDDYFDSQTAEYICPVTSQEMNGKSRFMFIWTCGCVVSEKALNEIKSERCHICNQPGLESDMILLNPSDDEIEALQNAMIERRAKAKGAKKVKDKKKDSLKSSDDGNSQPKKKLKSSVNGETPSTSTSRGLKSGSTVSSFASDILKSEEFKNVRSDKHTVETDKGKSEVYKSIFDTHKTAKNKPTGHWVTCNPQYF